MVSTWLVIGITGVTCGGKSTLSKKLCEELTAECAVNRTTVKVLSQDDYFYPEEDKRHVWVEEIKHVHYDIISSLDMEKMWNDVIQIIGNKKEQLENPANNHKNKQSKLLNIESSFNVCSVITKLKEKSMNILILEGFSLFECDEIYKICDLKYFFTLEYGECRIRRSFRNYEPPDCDGYFEMCVWPEYVKYLQLVQKKSEQDNLKQVKFFHSDNKDRSIEVYHDILQWLE